MLTLLGERTTASLWVSPSGCLLLHCHDVYSSLPLPPLLATAPVQTPSNHLQEFRHFRFLLPSLPIKLFVGGGPPNKVRFVMSGRGSAAPPSSEGSSSRPRHSCRLRSLLDFQVDTCYSSSYFASFLFFYEFIVGGVSIRSLSVCLFGWWNRHSPSFHLTWWCLSVTNHSTVLSPDLLGSWIPPSLHISSTDLSAVNSSLLYSNSLHTSSLSSIYWRHSKQRAVIRALIPLFCSCGRIIMNGDKTNYRLFCNRAVREIQLLQLPEKCILLRVLERDRVDNISICLSLISLPLSLCTGYLTQLIICLSFCCDNSNSQNFKWNIIYR